MRDVLMRADDRTIRVESPCCGLLYGAARASPSGVDCHVDCTRVTGAHVSDASDRQCTVGPSSGPRCAVCAGPNWQLDSGERLSATRGPSARAKASRSGFGQGARRPRKRTHRPHTPHPVVARRGPERPSVRPAGPAGSPGQRQRQHAHTTAWLFSDTLGRRGDITLSTGFPFRFTARRPFRFV